MIFTGFKRKSNQIFLNKRQSKLVNKTNVVSLKKIKKILVVCDDYSKKEIIREELLKMFTLVEKDIKWLFFQQKLPKELELDDIISPKDFGWYGKIKSENLTNILTKKYDLLINYSKIDCVYINLLLLHSKVGFKAGFSHLNTDYYNLLINCKTDEIDIFTEELKKYLSILNLIE
ncbi:MAG: hypothetical protein HKP59_05835 [Lutibacter sp.]|uniref:DUF6913 domain-containing protein n=1 Tax=Lutibacter sp. TaxID=1925666 RepID=UPI0017DD90B8|nr:hypothetical protein [Lutibacter sp.]MBT8317124.1 hypothetical protein [Lutibacter sp.]NNJ57984.1 hypothetical protein [Lutibacter sp.]